MAVEKKYTRLRHIFKAVIFKLLLFKKNIIYQGRTEQKPYLNC